MHIGLRFQISESKISLPHATSYQKPAFFVMGALFCTLFVLGKFNNKITDSLCEYFELRLSFDAYALKTNQNRAQYKNF